MVGWLEQNPAKASRAAVALSCVVASVFYGVGSYYGPEGHPAPIIRDAYIFHQYARQLAEGHPYQFNTGEAPTTACTSHLWPAILAVAYSVGARGWAMLSAAFAVNAVLLAASVALFGVVMRRLEARAAGLAVMMFALCGQVYITTLDQMDSALFLFVSLGIVAALLYERRGWLVGFAVVAPWCRPEGVLLAFFMFVAACARFWGNRRTRDSMLIAGVAGLASQGTVMGLNWLMTGTTTFHSVIGKSPFGFAPVFHVVGETIGTAGRMVRELGLGLADGQRQFMLPPVAGAVLVWIGLMSRDWRRTVTARAEACWLASAVAAFVLIAFSGWQGVQYDRYLTWMMPIAAAYMAMGIARISLNPARRIWGVGLTVAMLAWQGMGLVYLTTEYWGDCTRGGSNAVFLETLGKRFSEGASLGMTSGAGVKYVLPHCRIVNISGIETPEFAHRHPTPTNLEILKHKPGLRFEYWLLPATTSPREWFGVAVGEQVLAEVPAIGARNTHVLYRADWSRLDAAREIRSEAAREAVRGMELVDSLDIGWIEDETAHDYEIFTRIAGAKLRPFVEEAACGGVMIGEVGRVVIGSETFRIRATPGRDLRIVMRTRLAGSPVIHKAGDTPSPQDFQFASPLGLILMVDDGEPVPVGLTVSGGEGAFIEAVLDVPGHKIVQAHPILTVGGDHISCGYWFYQ